MDPQTQKATPTQLRDRPVLPGGKAHAAELVAQICKAASQEGFSQLLPAHLGPQSSERQTGHDQHPDRRPALAGPGPLADWQQVPALVTERYKEAASVQRTIAKMIKYLPAAKGYGSVWWNPKDKKAWITLGEEDRDGTHQKWHNALKAIPGIQTVTSVSEINPADRENWIRIKKAEGETSWMARPFEDAGKLTGGASPLTNAIVGGLLAGGVGYGAGALAEHVMPEQYVQRGRLRKVLGLAGAAAGTIPGLWQAHANQQMSVDAGKPLGIRALTTPNSQTPSSPVLSQELQQMEKRQGAASRFSEALDLLSYLPDPEPLFLKAAYGYSSGFGEDDARLRPVPCDAFNQAIWNDVSHGLNSSQHNPYGTRDPYGDGTDTLHTPPSVGAAATGLVSGIQSHYGGASLLSPRHFISGLAAAGVDLATAHVAGGVLGALGGLTPHAQNQLQQAGLWGGMIRGVVSSVFGQH